ncbi:MAG: ElyC/SanA/YdcF family protein, partial [Chthoniobacterales bacterium]
GRMDAAAALYREGKIRHLILSGDNRIVAYDEPKDMRAALLARGVPDSVLTLDDAGFRTLDSMARARAVFDLRKVTIITDDFHAARALVLARHFGLDPIAFTSAPVPLKWSLKTRVREVLARVLTILDITILQTKPHFLGNPEPVR